MNDLGASVLSSLRSLCSIPGNSVVPPERMTLPYKSLLMSQSQFITVLYNDWWTPGNSRPRLSGLNRASGALNLSDPKVITCF